MEIYSPPIRKTVLVQKNAHRQQPAVKTDKKYFKVEQKEKHEPEPVGEWIRRLFYERLRAFFEYEEVH